MSKILILVIVLAALAGAIFLVKGYNLSNLNNSTNGSKVVTTITPSEVKPTQAAGNNPNLNDEDVTFGLNLTITAPSEGVTLTTAEVVVQGTTSPNAEVSVNDKDLRADGNGQFSATVTLEEGENTIVIVANDVDGNFAERGINVIYQSQ